MAAMAAQNAAKTVVAYHNFELFITASLILTSGKRF